MEKVSLGKRIGKFFDGFFEMFRDEEDISDTSLNPAEEKELANIMKAQEEVRKGFVKKASVNEELAQKQAKAKKAKGNKTVDKSNNGKVLGE